MKKVPLRVMNNIESNIYSYQVSDGREGAQWGFKRHEELQVGVVRLVMV